MPVTNTGKRISDHGVSEAIYLNDPIKTVLNYIGTDQKSNGLIDEYGNLTMFTRRLDIESLLQLAN
jgi:catechol 2,3-dioxygenase